MINEFDIEDFKDYPQPEKLKKEVADGPVVHNKRTCAYGIYIGRPSKFGNPFVIGQHGSRADVIAQYKSWLLNQPNLIKDIKHELKGKSLVCWCSPLACHGNVLVCIANS